MSEDTNTRLVAIEGDLRELKTLLKVTLTGQNARLKRVEAHVLGDPANNVPGMDVRVDRLEREHIEGMDVRMDRLEQAHADVRRLMWAVITTGIGLFCASMWQLLTT